MVRSFRSLAADALRSTGGKGAAREGEIITVRPAIKISNLHFQLDADREQQVEQERLKISNTLGFER
jgi:hypothetical protein